MAPTFVSTLFSNRAGAANETPFPQPTPASGSLSSSNSSSASSSSKNANANNPRNTLTSLRKFRTSFSSSTTTSTHSSSTTTSTPASIDEEEDTATRDESEGKTGESLFASVPASYRYSLRPSTPLWSTMGAKLSKKTSKNATVVTSTLPLDTATPDSSFTSTESHAQHTTPISGDRDDYLDTSSPFGTVTRNTLKRTMSRLSLNAPTIMNGRKERERNATSTSGSSFRSRSSPRLGGSGSCSSRGSINRRESPCVSASAAFRLPNLQGFSPNLRIGLSDDDEQQDNEESTKRKSLKMEKETVAVEYGKVDLMRYGRSSVSTSSSSKTPTSSSSPSVTSSPTSRFTFSSSVSSGATTSSSTSISTCATTLTDETRYAELANLISIIDQSSILCRSPRTNHNNNSYTAPNTPILGRKLSSFSLSKSLSRSKLKVVNTSPVILQPAPQGRQKDRGISHITNQGVTSPTTATTALCISNLDNEKGEEEEKPTTFLALPFPRPLEARSYSFPHPSIRPIPTYTESDFQRHKLSKSLDDSRIAECSRRFAGGVSSASMIHPSRSSSKRNEYYNIIVDCELTAHTHHALIRKLSSSSTMAPASALEKNYRYPALCTPPRTPQSRHASVEWYADIEEDDTHESYEHGEAVVACDESTLMPPFLLRPFSTKSWDDEGSDEFEIGEDTNGQEETMETVVQQGEAYDSLMDIIDSFPSPTFPTSPIFPPSSINSTPSNRSPSSNSATSTSIANSDSPGRSPTSDSIWSFRRQTIFGSSTGSGCYYTPESSLATPASDITATPASSYFASRKREEEEKEEEEDRDAEKESDEGTMGDVIGKRVGSYVLASHRALTDMLESSDLNKED